MKIVEVEVTMTGLAVGVLFAWMRRNGVSLDAPEGWMAPMYCRWLGSDDGRRKVTQDSLSLLEVNCEREEPLI